MGFFAEVSHTHFENIILYEDKFIVDVTVNKFLPKENRISYEEDPCNNFVVFSKPENVKIIFFLAIDYSIICVAMWQ